MFSATIRFKDRMYFLDYIKYAIIDKKVIGDLQTIYIRREQK